MKNLTNFAYSEKYTKYKNETIDLVFKPANKKAEVERISGDLRRIVTDYEIPSENPQYSGVFCSHNAVYENNAVLFEYFSIYSNPFFCDKIAYSNGSKYVFYKTDLYGYSVFDMKSRKTFDYFPQCSFWDSDKDTAENLEIVKETFIATDIHFNFGDMFAVGGCYWACPSGVFLVKISDPMRQFEEYLDLATLIDGYDKYDDIDFLGWDGNAIKLKCASTEPPYNTEIITISEQEYLGKMIKI
ncbi:MAG: hypothetical protein FWG68_00040 [Defluviitaleaceae bacterium]|nr:hypothetical protein [Defluviitaleaceae bacterium]